MKKMYNLLALLLVAVVAINAQPIDVTNGGFENGIEEGWGYDINDGAAGEYSEETEDVYEGNNALLIYVDALGTNDWSSQIKNETFEVEKGKSYRFSIWAKDISDGEDTIKINFTSGMTNAVDTWHENSRLNYHPLTKEWAEYVIYFTPADEDIDAGLFAYMSNHFVSVGACIMDNFTVTETQTKEAMLSEDGTQVIVEFVEPIADPAGNEANFEVLVGGTANAVTAIAVDETSPTTLILTVTDAIAADASVEVNYTPGTLATTGGTEITEFTLTVGGSVTSIISNKADELVSLYPNPAKDVVSFDIDNVSKVEVYNITGKLMQTVKDNTNTIDISDLISGVYFVKINDAKGNVYTNRIIKE